MGILSVAGVCPSRKNSKLMLSLSCSLSKSYSTGSIAFDNETSSGTSFGQFCHKPLWSLTHYDSDAVVCFTICDTSDLQMALWWDGAVITQSGIFTLWNLENFPSYFFPTKVAFSCWVLFFAILFDHGRLQDGTLLWTVLIELFFFHVIPTFCPPPPTPRLQLLHTVLFFFPVIPTFCPPPPLPSPACSCSTA